MQIFVNPNYDFMKWRFRLIAISLIWIIAGFVLFAKNGVNWGIDFSGGANLVLKFREAVPLDQLRAMLPEATLQQYGKAEARDILIRLPKARGEGDYAGQAVALLNTRLNPESATKHDLNYLGSDRLLNLLQTNDPDKKGTNPAAVEHYKQIASSVIDRRSELGIFTSMQQVSTVPGVSAPTARVLNEKAFLGDFNVLNQETVGPQVGSELQRKAILALVLSTLAMGVYIAIRFDLKFGVAAVICMIYDVLVSLALLAFLNAEFAIITVAALLMVVGYSINDKVVLYDRVRENMRKVRNESFSDVLNRSLNQTLSRTVLTGGSVMLVLITLILFGGEVIQDFAALLLVGTIAGTYSTLTLAPAVTIAWNNLTSGKRDVPGAPAESRLEKPASIEARKRKAS